jgi:hypothetical protein
MKKGDTFLLKLNSKKKQQIFLNTIGNSSPNYVIINVIHGPTQTREKVPKGLSIGMYCVSLLQAIHALFQRSLKAAVVIICTKHTLPKR